MSVAVRGDLGAGVLQRHVRLGRLLALGHLVAGFHVALSLVLLKISTAVQCALPLAVGTQALAAAGLAGGLAA